MSKTYLHERMPFFSADRFRKGSCFGFLPPSNLAVSAPWLPASDPSSSPTWAKWLLMPLRLSSSPPPSTKIPFGTSTSRMVSALNDERLTSGLVSKMLLCVPTVLVLVRRLLLPRAGRMLSGAFENGGLPLWEVDGVE